MEYQFHLWPQDRYRGIEEVVSVVQAGERFGYTAAASGEHILVPNGPEAEVIGGQYFDLMVLFAYLAACTARIRLQLCALVVPYRHPGLAARGIASLDQASGGRVEVVVGSGWSADEFDALGLPFDLRGAVTDEYVEAMRQLWTEERPSFDGRFVSFRASTLDPKCVQKPHVPLWIGGSGTAAVRRMRRYGSGWAPMGGTLDSIGRGIEQMRTAVSAAGRSVHGLGFSYGLTYLESDPYSDVASTEVAHTTPGRGFAGSSSEAVDLIGTSQKSA